MCGQTQADSASGIEPPATPPTMRTYPYFTSGPSQSSIPMHLSRWSRRCAAEYADLEREIREAVKSGFMRISQQRTDVSNHEARQVEWVVITRTGVGHASRQKYPTARGKVNKDIKDQNVHEDSYGYNYMAAESGKSRLDGELHRRFVASEGTLESHFPIAAPECPHVGVKLK